LACIIFCCFDIEVVQHGEKFHSVFEQEAQKCLCDNDAVVVVREPIHAALVQLIGEDASCMPAPHNLVHDFRCEFWVSLDGNETTLLVHELILADVCFAKSDCLRRLAEDNVSVHLVETLFEN
jgi:hypothetical protein